VNGDTQSGSFLASAWGFGRLGSDVVEMVLADQDSWDRYEASKWLTMRRWLGAHPDEEFAREVRAKLTSEPQHERPPATKNIVDSN
jgi:hypothetical protein